MFKKEIEAAAAKYSLDKDVIASVIVQESAGFPFAVRYEPAFYRRYMANKGIDTLSGFVPSKHVPVNGVPNPSLDTELNLRSTSFGLMQVMGETARSIAQFKDPWLTKMLIPEIGIDVGCTVLRHYLSRAEGRYKQALSMYNSGTGNSERGLRYAEQVLTRIKNNKHLFVMK